MAMECGLNGAILNPNDKNLMNTVKTAQVILNETLYADSYLEL
jgi:5-methyltetrahydrofolate corrinoid/iron sulfur protein methyltransferase